MSTEEKLFKKEILIEKIESDIRDKEESLSKKNEKLIQKDKENSILRIAIIIVLSVTKGIAAMFIRWMTKVEVQA